MLNPLLILRESIKSVPAVKYALGVAGVMSVIVMVHYLNLDYKIALLGTLVMFLLMTLLVLFAGLVRLGPRDFRLPALVLTWFSLLLLMATVVVIFLAVFFKLPITLPNIFPVNPASTPTSGQPDRERTGGDLDPSFVPDKITQTGPTRDPDPKQKCHEIVFTDSSKLPPEIKKEWRCDPE